MHRSLRVYISFHIDNTTVSRSSESPEAGGAPGEWFLQVSGYLQNCGEGNLLFLFFFLFFLYLSLFFVSSPAPVLAVTRAEGWGSLSRQGFIKDVTPSRCRCIRCWTARGGCRSDPPEVDLHPLSLRLCWLQTRAAASVFADLCTLVVSNLNKFINPCT